MIERASHSIVSAETRTQYAVAQIGVIDFAVTSEFIEVPPAKNPRLDVILRRKAAAGEVRFADHWRPSDFQQLGTMFLFPSDQKLEIRSEQNQLSVFLCEFTSEALNRSLGEDCAWSSHSLRGCLDIHNRQILSAVLRLRHELQSPSFASDIMGEALATQIAIDLVRHFAPARTGDRLAAGGLSAFHLRLLLDRVHAGGSPPTLAELAELCGLSIRQLTRGFRASRGQSIGDYIAAYRLERAKGLLSSGHSIKQIAFDVGFKSPNHFAMAFRRETGLTPTAFRQDMRSSG